MRYKKNSALISMIICAVIGVAIIAISCFIQFKNTAFMKDAYKTEALITDTYASNSKYDNYSYTELEFVPKGQTDVVVVRIGSYSAFVLPGQTVEIYVSSSNYENIYVPKIEGTTFYVFLAIGSALIIATGIYFVVRIKNTAKLNKFKQEGRRIAAKISGFDVDYSTMVNGVHPLKVICEYDDGYTVKKYISTKHCIFESAFVVGDTIDVYELDNDYVVDLKEYLKNK